VAESVSGVRRHAWLATAMTAPMVLMPAVLAWQEWAHGDRIATWAGAAVAALAMAGTVAGIDALMRRDDHEEQLTKTFDILPTDG
jgi:hypothetical protein